LQAGFGGGVQEMRAYWNKYKGLNLNERCYLILKDDAAGSRWLEAASHLTQPENVTTFRGGFNERKPEPAPAPVRLRGEDIRNKTNPSVAGLMARRALEIPSANPNAYDLAAAGEMGLKLAAWDAQAAGPVLKSLAQRCATVMNYSGAGMGGVLAKLALARAQAGDPGAFDDYAAWLPTTTPAQLGYSFPGFLEPLASYPTNAVLESAAEKIFADTNPAWGRLPWQKNVSANPAASGLAKGPVFRALLARELDRKEVCGSISWQASGMVHYSISNQLGGSFIYDFPEARQTPDGTAAELRWCDWIALSLAQGKYIVPYNPFAPVAAREGAIGNAQAVLRRR